MNVIREKSRETKFREIKIGHCFSLPGSDVVYFKINTDDGAVKNSVELTTNTPGLICFLSDDTVIPVRAELHILDTW